MCTPINTASYIDPSFAFMTMKGGRKEKGFYLQLRLCSGFNRGRQGQQAGRGEAEGNCLGQRQRVGGGSQQQQEEQLEKLEAEPGTLINHARSERGMQLLDLQELSQAINFHWLPEAWSLEARGQKPEQVLRKPISGASGSGPRPWIG